MKRFVVFLITAIMFGLTCEVVAAQELTLDDCIEIALQNRAAIIRARGAATAAKWDRVAALGAFLPNVSGSYSYSKGKDWDEDPPDARATAYGDSIVTTVFETDTGTVTVLDAVRYPTAYELVTEKDTGPNKTWSLSGSLDLINLSNWFNYAAASAAVAQAKLNVLASEQDMIYAVKTSYYAFLASAENVAVQEDAVKRAEEQLKLIESRFELGSASKSDVLKQKVQYGNDQLAFLRATNSVVSAKADLAYTIGLDPSKEHEFETDYRVREYEGTLDEAITFAMEHNPSLLASGKNADLAKHYMHSAWSTYLPTVSGRLSYSKTSGTQGYASTLVDYEGKSRSVGFSVNWNIFDGFSRESRVASAKVSRNNALADEADTRNATVSNVKASYLQLAQLRKQVDVATENVAAAEEDMKITQEKYNLGAATILDLLDAQVSLKTAQVGLISAQFDLNLAIANLENAMGKM